MIHLLVNATVHTMDDSLPVAQALAVKDGRIVEVGGTDEILKNIIAERVLGLPGDVRVDKDVAFKDMPTGR